MRLQNLLLGTLVQKNLVKLLLGQKPLGIFKLMIYRDLTFYRRLSTSYISQSSGDDEPEPEPETFRGNVRISFRLNSKYLYECIIKSWHNLGQKQTKSEDPTLNDFILLKLLGEGSYGKVFLVKNTFDDKFYAMKRIRKDVIIEDKQIQFMKVRLSSFAFKYVVYLNNIYLLYLFS